VRLSTKIRLSLRRVVAFRRQRRQPGSRQAFCAKIFWKPKRWSPSPSPTSCAEQFTISICIHLRFHQVQPDVTAILPQSPARIIVRPIGWPSQTTTQTPRPRPLHHRRPSFLHNRARTTTDDLYTARDYFSSLLIPLCKLRCARRATNVYGLFARRQLSRHATRHLSTRANRSHGKPQGNQRKSMSIMNM
jgi:hypothetical protein